MRVEERQLAGVVRIREHRQHLAAEQTRQQIDVHEEVGAAGDPSRPVEGQPSDYRIEGPERWKTMRLHPHEFIRRFLLHVLPKGFHRIRHYGLFANAKRAENIAKARALLGADPPAADPQQQPDAPRVAPCPCPRCGARMIVIEVFARGFEPRWRPTPSGFDTS